jgi:hypothetical protein
MPSNDKWFQSHQGNIVPKVFFGFLPFYRFPKSPNHFCLPNIGDRKKQDAYLSGCLAGLVAS